jgi:hypothetical protein
VRGPAPVWETWWTGSSSAWQCNRNMQKWPQTTWTWSKSETEVSWQSLNRGTHPSQVWKHGHGCLSRFDERHE